MKQIKISDITMKQSAEDFSLSFKEKIEFSKLLDRLGVSVIELEGINSIRVDSLRIKSIAAAVKDSIIAVPVALDNENVQQVWNALKIANKPRLQVCGAVSSVQMEYLFHKKPEAMLLSIVKTIDACKALCSDVEFIADDATRSDPAFLYAVISAAIERGATVITVCDSAGNMMPDEFASFIKNLFINVPNLKDTDLAVSCSNQLSLADACTITAICQGAEEVKVASHPVCTASLENIARVISSRGESFHATCAIKVTQLTRIINQISWMCQSVRSKNTPFDHSVQDESDVYLTSHDDIAVVLNAVERLGYDLSEEDGNKVFEAFRAISVKKEQVTLKELDAIIASSAMQVPSTYLLDTYVITAGNTISSTAHIKLSKNDATLEGVCVGDGPIDAAFLAIESAVGNHYELDDFQIQAITEGREAMGQTIVKLRSNGKLYSGKGISTDIVGASIHAYLSALNKIVYEEDAV